MMKSCKSEILVDSVENAVKFYSQAANQVPEHEIKDFFKALMEIESDHIVLTDKK